MNQLGLMLAGMVVLAGMMWLIFRVQMRKQIEAVMELNKRLARVRSVLGDDFRRVEVIREKYLETFDEEMSIEDFYLVLEYLVKWKEVSRQRVGLVWEAGVRRIAFSYALEPARSVDATNDSTGTDASC